MMTPMHLLRAGVAAAALAVASCAPTGTAETTTAAAPAAVAYADDIHSYAEPEVARVSHVDLDLKADFDAKRLSGKATLDIVTAPGADRLLLDTKGLEVSAVHDGAGRPLEWSLGTADPILGAPLSIALGDAKRVVISYRTGPEAPALQWLTPAQTAGGKKPYLFSQGQAILNRTWIPTQDSPGIRQTWSARITVPEGLRAVMSAEMLTPEGEPVPGGRAFGFRMNQPVAPYLIAIAVGDLAFKALGPRTGVYTEPAMLEKAAWELADVEKMVEAAESLYGPYRWGRYDLLVLPPSFPFGGMENPRLTFATPTIIAGDRSLVSLVAHELAHSWSGNLVTNATWADFWLNEGFTTYFENRIMEALYGPRRAAMLADLGWDGLQDAIQQAGGPAAPDTRLHLDLKGRDPDDGMTEIAYEKGATFLRTIEAAVGRKRWDAYLRSYFDRHAFQSQTTSGFLADLRANLIKGDQALEEKLQLDRWVFEPGLPDNAVHVTSEAFAAVDAAARAFAEGKPASAVASADWTTSERVRFLNSLLRKLEPARLSDLDRSLGLSNSGNSEVRFAWLRLAIANRYQPAVASVEQFLTSQGRRKFVEPLFRDLMAQGDWGQGIARAVYQRARPAYHSVTVGSVDRVVR